MGLLRVFDFLLKEGPELVSVLLSMLEIFTLGCICAFLCSVAIKKVYLLLQLAISIIISHET